jgi:hypothetical protein
MKFYTYGVHDQETEQFDSLDDAIDGANENFEIYGDDAQELLILGVSTDGVIVEVHEESYADQESAWHKNADHELVGAPFWNQ